MYFNAPDEGWTPANGPKNGPPGPLVRLPGPTLQIPLGADGGVGNALLWMAIIVGGVTLYWWDVQGKKKRRGQR
jgi:hypothetical protein